MFNKLSKDQELAIKNINEFLDSDEHQVFILTGPAGSGKTTIISQIIKENSNPYRKFVLLATTGKAASIIYRKTGIPAQTVHSTIYVPDNNFVDEKTGHIRFKLKDISPPDNTIYIVDEASMMKAQGTRDYFISFGTGNTLSDFFYYIGNSKVIFIGDRYQLPPVKEDFSAALHPEFLQKEFGKKTMSFELKNIHRYPKNSGIYLLSKHYRHLINNDSTHKTTFKKSSDVIDYTQHEWKDFTKSYIDYILKNGLGSSVIIVPRNKLAQQYTHAIRENIFIAKERKGCLFAFLRFLGIRFTKKEEQVMHTKIGKSSEVPLLAGEPVMVFKNNYKYNLMNGDRIYVHKILEDNIRVERLPFTYMRVVFRNTPDYEQGITKTFETYVLKDFIFKENAFLEKTDTQKIMIYLSYKARERRNKNHFLNYKEHLMELMKKDPYFNALLVKHAYAITCHKAQGDEWDEVFLHIEHFKEHDYRWLYTALTRAEKKVHRYFNYVRW